MRVDLRAVAGQIWGDEDIKINCELVRSVKRNLVIVDIVAYLLRYISSQCGIKNEKSSHGSCVLMTCF